MKSARAFVAGCGIALLCASLVSGWCTAPARGDDTPQVTTTAGDLTHPVYTATERLGAAVIAPAASETVTTTLSKVAVATVKGAGVELAVSGNVIPLTQLGSRSEAPDGTTIYTYYGVRFEAGPNLVEVTALGADGVRSETTQAVIYGAGAPAALRGVLERQLQADGQTAVTLTVHASDRWGHPAITGSAVRASVTSGAVRLRLPLAGNSPAVAPSTSLEVPVAGNGEARMQVVPGTTSGDAAIALSSGDVRETLRTFVTPYLRKALVVGMVSAGAGPVPGSRDGDARFDAGASKRARAAFFATGESLRGVATTIAYDTAKHLAASAELGPFVDDVDEQPFRTYGDDSVQRSDALSNGRLYARLESGRNALTLGRFQADIGAAASGPSAYQAVLSGVRVELADRSGNVRAEGFTARSDLAFARELFDPLGLATAGATLHPNIVVGSESVSVAALDRRTGAVVAETPLQRDVDYVIDTLAGVLRFIAVPLPYDASFRRQVVVVRYQYAGGTASRTTGGRLATTLARGNVTLGAGYVNDVSGAGNFSLFEQSARVTTALGRFDIAHVSSEGFVPGSTLQSGGALWHAEFNGRRGATTVAAAFDRAGSGFNDPFGGLVTGGLSEMRLSVTHALARKGEVRLGFDAQHDDVSGNTQRNLSLGMRRTFSSRFTGAAELDLRRSDIASVSAAALQARLGGEYLLGAHAVVRAERIMDFGRAGATTQPGQTTVALDGRLDERTHLVIRSLWQDAPAQPFAASAATPAAPAMRSTSVALERRLGAATTLSSGYSLDRSAGGNQLSTTLGVREALAYGPRVKGSAYLQTASNGGNGAAADAGSGYTAYGFDLSYAAPKLHLSASLQERAGALGGATYTALAAGSLSPDLSLVGDVRAARTGTFTDGSTRIGLAWRPQRSDRGAALFELDRRDGTSATAGERVDTLAAEAAWHATRRLELDWRIVWKLDGDGFYAAHTYLAGLRIVQRVGARADLGVEQRVLGAPGTTSAPRRELSVETGYRLGDRIRLAAGYNVTGSADPELAGRPNRKGAFFTVTSVLSRVFGWGR